MLRLRLPFLLSSFLSTALAVFACSQETIVVQAAKPADAGGVDPDAGTETEAPDAEIDAADPLDETYPTAHTPIPLVDFHGGAILRNPKIVTVTFGADPRRARLEQFGDTITATPWWDAVRDGYCAPVGSTNCVGRGSGGGHVNMTTPPSSEYTDSSAGQGSSLQEFLVEHIRNGTLPAPTPDTLYAIYLPAGVTVVLDGTASCQGFGGYHNTFSYADGDGGADMAVPYAIMPRCDSSETTLTIAASHEFIEAATDPYIGTGSLAYYMRNQLWAFAGGEVGDVCVDFTPGGNDTVHESSFTVQRSWSNKAAKASHDPCVPAPAGQPYFNAAPKAGQEEIPLAVGESAVVEITAFSDGPMADWQISAIDFDQFQTGTSHLSFKFDKTTVHNGSKVQLTVKLVSAPSASQGGSIYAIVSQSGKITHLWPAAVIRK